MESQEFTKTASLTIYYVFHKAKIELSPLWKEENLNCDIYKYSLCLPQNVHSGEKMENGDFIKINFEMRLGNDKKLVATNQEKIAKENNIFDEEGKYRETVLIVGSEEIFKEINESFRAAKIGSENEVHIPVADAYGARDSANIKVHTMREFQRNKIDPVPGQEVRINNRKGKVISVSPGRVLVDYNHPWAGRDLFYKYSITGKLETAGEKANSIVDMNYSKGSGKFEISENGDTITIQVPEEAKFDIEWLDAKFRVIDSIRKNIPKYKVLVSEEYLPKEEEKPEEEKGKEEIAEEKQEEVKKEEVKKTPAKAKQAAKPKTEDKPKEGETKATPKKKASPAKKQPEKKKS